jgi:ABC-type taurine transport system substrate-binding protein
VTRYLVGAASVHVAAAAADYLVPRLAPADEVVLVGVREPEAPVRDVEDAANVARSRLGAAAPTIDRREGESGPELRAAIEAHDPDVVVIGPNAGTAEAGGLGATAASLLAETDRAVVVVPTALGPGGTRGDQS